MYGPFNTGQTVFHQGSANRRIYWNREWWRMGSKRRVQPLPYFFYWSFAGTPAVDAPNSEAGHWCAVGRPDSDPFASNAALARFVAAYKDGATASLAVTLAEWNQSEKMIVARAGQLLGAVRNLRKGDIAGARKSLGMPSGPRRTRRGDAKGVANSWLELNLGWSPLVGDIYDAVNVLQSSPPAKSFKGTGHHEVRIPIVGNDFHGLHRYDVWSKIQAEVYVDNPNLALANQMGLINPATVAWELVPFSFVVDWFLPVGKFLNSFSDQVGYRVENAFTTTKRVASTDLSSPYPHFQWENKACFMRRQLGIPSYQLRPVQFKGFSVSRGATAISLLVQQFLSVKTQAASYRRT